MKYIIDNIEITRASNKAQEFVYDKIRGLIHKTITDDDDFENLVAYLKEQAEEAARLHPRCAHIIVGGQKDLAEGYHIYLHTENKSGQGYLANMRIVEIKDNWKGNLWQEASTK